VERGEKKTKEYITRVNLPILNRAEDRNTRTRETELTDENQRGFFLYLGRRGGKNEDFRKGYSQSWGGSGHLGDQEKNLPKSIEEKKNPTGPDSKGGGRGVRKTRRGNRLTLKTRNLSGSQHPGGTMGGGWGTGSSRPVGGRT